MNPIFSQEEHPFRQLEHPQDNYDATQVFSRMLDGLGFRYYWATAQLQPGDLDYRPSDEGRTMKETLQHLYGLSHLIRAVSAKEQASAVPPPSDLQALREQTLALLLEARENFSRVENLSEHPIRFGSGSEFSFGYLLNGPVADALWHCGQVVLLRRASGNPLPEGVSFFKGTYKKPEKTAERKEN